jgi:hypothetical protein
MKNDADNPDCTDNPDKCKSDWFLTKLSAKYEVNLAVAGVFIA